MPEPAGHARRAVLAVRVHPRAARDRVGPVLDGVIEIRVTRPASDGQANAAVRRLVADTLGLAPSRLRLLGGERARLKRYEVEGIEPADLATRIGRIGDGLD